MDFRIHDIKQMVKALYTCLKAAGVKQILLTMTNVANTVKSIPINLDNNDLELNPEKILEGGAQSAFVNGIPSHSWDYVHHGSQQICEYQTLPDIGTLHILPYNPTSACIYSYLYSKPGIPALDCPRNFLKHQIEKAKAIPLYLDIGTEVEFYIFDENGPLSRTYHCSSRALSIYHKFTNEIIEALSQQKNGCQPIEQFHCECGPGQFEIVVRHCRSPMAIADSIITIRETVHTIAIKHGYNVSFLPKPLLGDNKSACGLHYHLSFSDKIDGDNLLAGNYKHGLSEVGRILKHLPGLAACTQPSYNSLSGRVAGSTFGSKNKFSAIRFCNHFKSEQITHEEYRMSDCRSNPYIALGSLIASIIDGIESKIELDEEPAPMYR